MIEITEARNAQEAITNAIKHGKAKSITIKLLSSDDGLELRIGDDGSGFDCQNGDTQSRLIRGNGMRSMDYRASVIGGALKV